LPRNLCEESRISVLLLQQSTRQRQHLLIVTGAIEKELHRKYKDVRLPQTEYFRLSDQQLAECIRRLSVPFPWMTVIWIGSATVLALAVGIATYTNMPKG